MKKNKQLFSILKDHPDLDLSNDQYDYFEDSIEDGSTLSEYLESIMDIEYDDLLVILSHIAQELNELFNLEVTDQDIEETSLSQLLSKL